MNWIIYTVIALAYFVSFWKLFAKAGRTATEGLIPIYNIWILLTHIIKKPWWWMLLLLFPGVNIIMIMVISVNIATVFGKRSNNEAIMAALIPFIFLPKIAFDDKTKYVGPIDRKKYKKTVGREWGDAIIFAIVAASIIRTYFLEAFTIPTSSMEKSLLIGDYLFVSKVSYGPKIPVTPLSFPFAHHTLPLTKNVQSYLKWMELPYYRLPGLSDIDRNDVVVFNYPEGDTVVLQYQSTMSYNALVRDRAYTLRANDYQSGKQQKTQEQYRNQARTDVKNNFKITVRPVDKRENYIKRCTAIPGDKLEVRNGKLIINDETADIPEDFQYNYAVDFAQQPNERNLKDRLDINLADIASAKQYMEAQLPFTVPLTLDSYEKMKAFSIVKDIKPSIEPLLENGDANPRYPIFPNDGSRNWTRDNFGPIVIPKKGETVPLTLENLPLYKRVIHLYEGNELEVRDSKIFINGEESSTYTFQMNYYWLMGDNRHNSADSRFWGFVPEDHVVGKAVFVWLSMDPERGMFDGKIRWNRLFTFID